MKEEFLKKHGIKVNRELDRDERRMVSSNIAGKIVGSFASINADYFDLFSCLYDTNMYYAEIPNDISPVNYSYKENSIYISNKIDISTVNPPLLFEGLHKIEDDKYSKIGFCNRKTGEGLMLTEAANQYMVNKILGSESNFISKFDIKLNTKSKNHYPITSNIIETIVLLVGDKELSNSLLLADGNFEHHLKCCFGYDNYYKIVDNLDDMLSTKLSINKYNKEEKINHIKELYYSTQKTIYENYYNFVEITNIEDAKSKLELLQTKFENTELSERFAEFYKNKEEEIKVIEFNSMSLTVVEDNFIKKLFSKFKILNKLLGLDYDESSDK